MTESAQIERYFDRLWPICRSIAGPGFRDSLDILSELMPMGRHRFKTGKKVFDWTVPKEWSVRDAYLVDPKGKRRAQFKKNNLHLLNHSVPFKGTLSLEQLRGHLHSLPDQPSAIPYLTSYYAERWGFCLADGELKGFPRGKYKVVVDTELKPGFLELGEAVLKGRTDQEVLLSTYLCHPSLANNELSGPLVAAFLYRRLAARKNRRFTYRFVVAPETIGALCFLSLRGALLKKKLAAGFVITCVGDKGAFTYKQSRRGDALPDRAARAVLKELGLHRLEPFVPRGSDERQYCSPGFDLPVGSLMRTMYGRYPEYHTSLDNKSFISFPAMLDSVSAYEKVVDAIEENHVWKSTSPHGEPQLSSRGLYPTLGGPKHRLDRLDALMWLLNLADGKHDLLAVAERSGCRLSLLMEAAKDASKAGLIAHGP